MTKVVISQPMYFPWVGLLEQIQLADVFVHYSDVQFARGFFNRVQVKTAEGVKWLTVPLRDLHRGQMISEVRIDERNDWRSSHREILRQAHFKSPYLTDLLAIFDRVASQNVRSLADLTVASVMELVKYFGLDNTRRFCDSQNLATAGTKSMRLLNLVLLVGGTEYVTGHGASNYLDHMMFENAGVTVSYVDYRMLEYPQAHGAFTPYVTSLDLVANCGVKGKAVICSGTKSWREFIK